MPRAQGNAGRNEGGEEGRFEAEHGNLPWTAAPTAQHVAGMLAKSDEAWTGVEDGGTRRHVGVAKGK